MPPATEQSWVEVVSSGHGADTKVFLVVASRDGTEMRYRIPSVRSVMWSCEGRDPGMLTLELHDAHARVRAPLASSKLTADDLLAEIAAGRLAADKGDAQSFVEGVDWGQPLLDALEKGYKGVGIVEPDDKS
jgi:hypothetical protein